MAYTSRREGFLRLIILTACVALASVSASWAQQTRWYFAEGATGPFEEDVIVANPSTSTAQVQITFLTPTAAPQFLTFDLPPTTRKAIRVNTVPGLANAEVSAIVESLNGVPIAAERTMYWGGATKRGGHNATGIDLPRTAWYLAEGASGSFFHSYVLISNPGAQDANVTVRFLKDDGSVVTQTYTVLANRRYSVDVNAVPGMATGSFGAAITSTAPVLVERAMYWSSMEGGSAAAAVSAPATTWMFAEGTVGGDFQTFILLSNPSTTTSTTATVTFYPESGATVTKAYTVPASGRYTVFVNQIPEMAGLSFATTVTSVLPIVAERAIYWGNFIEGNAASGVTQASTKWGFTEGRDGTHEGVPFTTFFLLLNTSSTPLTVHGTFYLEDGTGSVYDIVVPAHARYTLNAADAPRMAGQQMAAFFEASAPFVAERATYWGSGWYGGHGSSGIPWTGTIAPPSNQPRAVEPTFSTPSGTFNSDFTIQLTSSTPGATIRYTMDGSDPTAGSPVAAGVVPVTQSVTIKAKTFATNYLPSVTTTATYTMVAPPATFQSPSGPYASPIDFVISTPLVNSTIRYSTDGSEPTEAHLPYTGPIHIQNAQLLTLKAKVFRFGWTPSATVTAVYDISQGVLQMPVASPAAGVYTEGQTVTVSPPPAQSFVTVRYTTNGSDPTEASPVFTGPLTLTEPLTLKARSFNPGYSPSPVLTAQYDVRVQTPTVSPDDGAFAGPYVNVSVSTATSGATLRYTLDRTDPIESSPQLFGSLQVNVGTTLKVRAYKTGWVASEIGSGTYWSTTVAESPGEFTVTGVDVAGFNSPTANLAFQLTNASLDPSSVVVLQNGSPIDNGLVGVTNAMVNGIAVATATTPDIVDGRNEVEIYGTDLNGLEVYDRAVVWAGYRNGLVHVQNTSGASIAGAQVRLALVADEAMDVTGATNSAGNYTASNLPTMEPFLVEVSADGYQTTTAQLPAGTTSVTVPLPRKNLSFEAGTVGWTGSPVMSVLHSEPSFPLVDCPGCPIRNGAGASGQNAISDAATVEPSDILMRDNYAWTQASTFTFKTSPGTRRVHVRYRMQTTEFTSPTPAPDRFTVRLRSVTTGQTQQDSRTVVQAASSLDQNWATPWLELDVPITDDGETVELRIQIDNANDLAYDTGIYVDYLKEDVYKVSAFNLFDYRTPAHTHRRAAAPLALDFISGAVHQYYNGATRVNGTITINAPQGTQVSDVSLELAWEGFVLGQTPLTPELQATLLQTVGPSGAIAVTADRRMFDIGSGQFAFLNVEDESVLTARVRVTFGNGVVVTKALGRRLPALTLYQRTNRYPPRDPGDCTNLLNPFPCGGDDWARLKTVAFIGGVNGTTWGDFSNMNGGWFPPHGSHQSGLDIDGIYSGYARRDAAAAATMIGYLNQYGRKIAAVFVAYTRVNGDVFYDAIKDVVLTDGRRATNVIKADADHTGHFHWRLDLSQLP